MIEIINLEKSFGTQKVLRGINLRIETGEVAAILGLLKPDGGQVLIDGIDITGLGTQYLDKVREKFAVVFQFGALFDSMTIFENVAFPAI